jgi:hypothetical protein
MDVGRRNATYPERRDIIKVFKLYVARWRLVYGRVSSI